jgi:hypothetical protein
MPNRRTFTIKPIAELLAEVIANGDRWLDPFANEARVATVTNDLNPAFDCDHNLDAYELADLFPDESFDGLLFDPPYSLRQVREVYDGFGAEVITGDPNRLLQSELKNRYGRLVRPGGRVICFGWTSNGFGKTRGFELESVLLVPHGGPHHDTIVTVERKVQASLARWS